MAGGVRPGLTHIQLAIGRGRIGHQHEVADEGVGDSDTCQSLVASVAHSDGVVDDFASGVGRTTRHRGVLDDVQRSSLLHHHRGIVGVWAGLVRVGRGDVEDVAARVDVGLGHHMGAGPGPAFAHIQFAIGRSRIGHQHQVADHRVTDRHAGEHLVARVLHGDGVGDDFTHHVGGSARD